MRLQIESVNSVPEQTKRIAQASFPKGNAPMHRFYRGISAVTLASLLVFVFTNQPLRAQGEVVIPFTLTAHNNIVVSALFNNKDTLKLMLHTAVSDVTITQDAARRLKSLTFTGKNQVTSWGGAADARVSKGNSVQIGPLQRTNLTLWEDKLSGEETGGKFGLDFFQKRIVEIDFDHRRLVLHEKLPTKVEKCERLKMENHNGALLVAGSCLIEGKTYTHRFLLHTGYSGGILLDDAFAAQTGLDGKITITDESRLMDSFGRTIVVKKGLLPVFALGRFKISQAPVGFFAGALGSQKMSVIGSAILMQFNLIFDTAHNALYLSPRHA